MAHTRSVETARLLLRPFAPGDFDELVVLHSRDAGTAALEAGFDAYGLDSILSMCEPENVSSWRVMERLGMHLARETMHPTLELPLWVYEITAEAWSSTWRDR